MLYELIGWAGAIAILLAYLLVTIHKINSASKEYQLLNLFGAVGIIVNSAIHGALPSVGLNILWLLIAAYGSVKSMKK